MWATAVSSRRRSQRALPDIHERARREDQVKRMHLAKWCEVMTTAPLLAGAGTCKDRGDYAQYFEPITQKRIARRNSQG